MRVQGWRVFLMFLLFGCGARQTPAASEELLVELRGNRVVFNHQIEFAHDSDRLEERSYAVLDAICDLLRDHPEVYRVQVQGHTSTDGDEAHNQELSARRAAAVAVYLREHGVDRDVTSQGYGETYPRCHDQSDACHAENRRVEFFVDAR